MRQIILCTLLAISMISAQENIPQFLQPDAYDQITQTWVSTHIIHDANNIISPDDMQVLLNALYGGIEWICYEQEANRYFTQAAHTFINVKNLIPSGVTDIYDINTHMQILAKQLSFCLTYKQKAARAHAAFAQLEPRLLNEPLASVWQALEQGHADMGQALLAYDIAISQQYLNTAQEEIVQSLATIDQAQSFIAALSTTVHQTTIDNLVEAQNNLINKFQDDIDETIDSSHQTLFALESLQAHSTNLERSVYKTIFYAYYRALYNAMKSNTICDQYFTKIHHSNEGEILIYLPDPSLLQ